MVTAVNGRKRARAVLAGCYAAMLFAEVCTVASVIILRGRFWQLQLGEVVTGAIAVVSFGGVLFKYGWQRTSLWCAPPPDPPRGPSGGQGVVRGDIDQQ